MRERLRNLVKYVQSYEDYLLNKDTPSELAFRNQLESELELDGLIHLREIVMERLNRKSRELVQVLLGKCWLYFTIHIECYSQPS